MTDIVLGRNIALWLIEDQDPAFPPELKSYCQEVDHVLLIDDKLAVKRWRDSLDRTWFCRDSMQSADYIDRNRMILEKLARFVHFRSKAEIAEEVSRYLPD